MLASNGLYEGYCWRRERDSNDLLSNESSNLLTPLEAQGALEPQNPQSSHSPPTGGPRRRRPSASLPLSGKHGLTAVVDLDIYRKIKRAGLRFYSSGKGKWIYAQAHIFKGKGNDKVVQLHRWIMDAQAGQVVDHINGDRMDNRRENLRLCTVAQNIRNQKLRASKSGFKGVFEKRGKWQASYTFEGKKIYIGKFSTPEEAARAYDAAAREAFGEFALLNFPDGGDTGGAR